MPIFEELVRLVHRGPLRVIYAYKDPNGGAPAFEFLNGLDAAAKARYMLRFVKMGNEGRLRGTDFHPWDDSKNKGAKGLGAFKDIASKTRIPSFAEGEQGVLVLTHGFGGKKEDDIDTRQVNEAIRIRQDYHNRKTELLKTHPRSTTSACGRKR